MSSVNTKKSINIDNTSGSIIVSGNKFLKLNDNGGVLIGGNENILDEQTAGVPDNTEEYKGVMVYNKLLYTLRPLYATENAYYAY